MTKSTITRERLQELAEGQSGFNLRTATHEESQELARMALAAMDSSESVELPLDYLQGHKDGLEWAARLAEANHPDTGDWLYDDPIELAKAIRKGPDMPPVQPAPVVPDDVLKALQKVARIRLDMDGFDGDRRGIADCLCDAEEALIEVVNRRAAMLQAGTLTNEDTKQAWTGIPDIDNAINMLDRIDTLESCDDDRIEAVKTVLRGLAGNSPAIPDGYVMVPVEPTKEILDEFDSIIDYGAEDSVDAWHRLLAAAPQSPGSEPATVPGEWIPVSEQMPPSRHEVLVGRWWGEKPRWCCKWATYIPGHPDSQSSGWLIPGASWTPTHWMPLPAAPQEPSLACISKRSQHLS